MKMEYLQSVKHEDRDWLIKVRQSFKNIFSSARIRWPEKPGRMHGVFRSPLKNCKSAVTRLSLAWRGSCRRRWRWLRPPTAASGRRAWWRSAPWSEDEAPAARLRSADMAEKKKHGWSTTEDKHWGWLHTLVWSGRDTVRVKVILSIIVRHHSVCSTESHMQEHSRT